jgi:NAD(P)H-hydrate epimerase
MKILSTKQLREADQFTIDNNPIASISLMERASTSCTEWIEKMFSKNHSFSIFCGIGNNGGNGLAIAQVLSQKRFRVRVFIVGEIAKATNDFQINYNRIPRHKIEIQKIQKPSDFPRLIENELIIDAIYGSGLNKPVEGLQKDVIQKINDQLNKVISIDIPSGLFGEDNSGNDSELIIQADYTLTFQQPKLSFLLSDFGQKAGNWQIIDIGLSVDFIEKAETKFQLLTQEIIQNKIRSREKFSYKGTYGHALIIAGSLGKMGASVLSTKAALRSGAGLVTSFVPKCGYEIIQITNPEAMSELSSEENFLTGDLIWKNYTAIGIGPGIGKEIKTMQLIEHLFNNYSGPLVLDADALNIISEYDSLFAKIPENSIITPHPKEFDRLFGKSISAFARLNKQIEQAKKLKCYIILKGTYTSICDPDGMLYFNNTGNSGMAKGGSGDVLTGLLTGLLAQGYSTKDACHIGVWIHGLAGDFATQKKNQITMTAMDLIESLTDAFDKTKSDFPPPYPNG